MSDKIRPKRLRRLIEIGVAVGQVSVDVQLVATSPRTWSLSAHAYPAFGVSSAQVMLVVPRWYY